MSIATSVIEKLYTLPPDQQQEVLNFVEFLQHKQQQAARRNRFVRLQAFAQQNAALNADLSDEEAIALIEEAREDVYHNRAHHRD